MIEDYGWSPALQSQFLAYEALHLTPARVVIQQRETYRIAMEAGEMDAQIGGRFRFHAEAGGYPVTGDWVAVSIQPSDTVAVIQHVLPRRTAFTRKAAGEAQTRQVVAANIDLALLVTSLNADLNLRRLERLLVVARESGAKPVIVLTKADLAADIKAEQDAVRSIALDVPVISLSARTGEGLETLRSLLLPGLTAAVIGSSGVGKSTLVNALAGTERMATQAIRDDDARGRHTTSHRELLLLEGGGCIIDTPGMREIGLWEAEAGIITSFADIEELAANCRFRDCAHGSEPGCAVQAAIATGGLDATRLASFRKLQKEARHIERKENPLALAADRKRWARLSRQYRGGKKPLEE